MNKIEFKLKKYFNVCESYSSKYKKLPVRTSDHLTVIGSGVCLIESIKKMGYIGDIMSVNVASFFFPENRPYQHIVSYRYELFELSEKIRIWFRQKHKCISHSYTSEDIKYYKNKADYFWNIKPMPQSSGFLACTIGVILGYKKIILHGIPMDDTMRFHETISNSKTNYDEIVKEMDQSPYLHINKFKDIVKSCSGVTMKILGYPDKEWLRI